MKRPTNALSGLLLAGLLSATVTAQADEPTESYGAIVGRKVLNGFANILTGPAEIPKNIIIVNNESNIVWGIVGGSIKGIINTAGRMGVGAIELVSAPIPTYPIIYPAYIWDDFYAETTYGPAFVGEKNQ